jgi:hypothetical protein
MRIMFKTSIGASAKSPSEESVGTKTDLSPKGRAVQWPN